MKLINCMTGEVLAEQVKVTEDFLSRLIGLMGRKTMAEGSALVLRPCRSVHTFFMCFNIDLVFLDLRGMVVHLIRDMPPFRISPLVRRASLVVELPGGTVRNRLWPGDILKIAE
ncbi:MAG: DUF192 domain-containing protein [Bacillota bacterium]